MKWLCERDRLPQMVNVHTVRLYAQLVLKRDEERFEGHAGREENVPVVVQEELKCALRESWKGVEAERVGLLEDGEKCRQLFEQFLRPTEVQQLIWSIFFIRHPVELLHEPARHDFRGGEVVVIDEFDERRECIEGAALADAGLRVVRCLDQFVEF